MPPKKKFHQANLSSIFQAPTPSPGVGDIDALIVPDLSEITREIINESSSSCGCSSHKYILIIVF